MSATEAFDFEREFGALVRELRALPGAAPENVRERVRALGEPVAAPRRLPVVAWRRTLLVLAPVCVLGVVVAAVVHGALNSGAEHQTALERVPAGAAPRANPAHKTFAPQEQVLR